MRFFILLLPWLELFTLIKLGVETSAGFALLYVFGTLVLGLAVMRRQGRNLLLQMQQNADGRILWPQLLVDDMALGLAGLLLVIPGMITDLAAIVVMIGPLRRRLARWLGGPQPEPYAPERDSDARVTIEGDYRRVDR
jgi:UPF0716 protein FxsA